MIKALGLDVDGVLTDGSLFYSAQGEIFKNFNAKDGWGIKKIMSAGIVVGIFTGRESNINVRRFDDLGITDVYQGLADKRDALDNFFKKYSLCEDEMAYMGDDELDLPILKRVGVAGCPSDAIQSVKSICHFQSLLAGGLGAVREFCEHLLRHQ